MITNSGPKIEPYGTHVAIGNIVDIVLYIGTE